MNKVVFSLLLMIALASCASPGQLNEGISATEIDSAEPSSGEAQASPPAIEGPQKQLMRSQYQLDVIFDYAEKSISVREQINYLNSSTSSLDEILLLIDAERQGAEFLLEQMSWADGKNIEDYSVSDSELRIVLQESLLPGEYVPFTIHYQLALPALEGPLGYSIRQTNFADWYPYVPPYLDDNGWLVHSAAEVGEHLVYESADFDVRIKVINAPNELRLAAPAISTNDDGTFIYELEKARRFAWSASDQYKLLQTKVGGIPLIAYVFPEHQDAGLSALESSAEALQVFEKLFGPYPYKSLSLVEAEFPDGLESDALFFLSQDFFANYTEGRQNYLSTLSVHEVAHNWWFGLVGNDPALEPWLDEALATYSEVLYYENVYPELSDWWWLFRILDYSPRGDVDSSIYSYAGFSPYVNAVYFRGALFLHKVRSEIGDEAFLNFLQMYIKAGEGRLMREEDFFNLLDSGDHIGINDLIEEYFSK
jgi:hypothetical protein